MDLLPFLDVEFRREHDRHCLSSFPFVLSDFLLVLSFYLMEEGQGGRGESRCFFFQLEKTKMIVC